MGIEDVTARLIALEAGLEYPPTPDESEAMASTRSLREPPRADINLNVPYIHQLWDTPDNFWGKYACGPTSTTMVLTYYGVLEPKPITVSKPQSHGSAYGWYLPNAFTHNNRTFDLWAGTPDGTAQGIYGTIVDNVEGLGWVAVTGQAGGKKGVLPVMETFLKPVGNTVEVIWSPTEEDVRASIDEGHPVVISGRVFGWGHLIVVRGYYRDPDTKQYHWIVNDPHGYQVAGKYDGANVVYQWNEIYHPDGKNSKYMFRVRGAFHNSADT